MAKLRSPIKWFGGKGQMTANIVPILEAIPHIHYAEPFGGGASILLAKSPPGGVETYNDMNNALYDLFTVLVDPDLFSQFYARAHALPYSRQLYNECRAGWQDEPDLIKRVVMWYVVARQSFSGIFSVGWSSDVTHAANSRAHSTSQLMSIIDMLPAIHARLQRVQIENVDGLRIIERYDTGDTLIYCDPPYVADTRKAGGYTHEMTDADHAALVNALLNMDGCAVLSGYASDVYAPLQGAGWTILSVDTASHAAGRTRASNLQGKGSALKHQKRTEMLYINPRAAEHIGDVVASSKWQVVQSGSMSITPVLI